MVLVSWRFQNHLLTLELQLDDSNKLLKMQGTRKEFPGVKALQDVDFSLNRGEVRILIGENGDEKIYIDEDPCWCICC